jgi:hypothetical protein
MTAITMGTIMDSLGTALATISGLRVFDFPPKSAQPPFAFVAMPDSIDYNLTFGRALDRASYKVYVGVANVVDRAARDELALYVGETGAKSIKAALEAATGAGAVRVERAEFSTITLAAGEYAGITFLVDVAA